MKACRGSSRGVAPLILNFGTGWRSVVNFTSPPLYLLEITVVPTEFRRLGRPWGLSGRFEEERRDGKARKKT
jgi:hypothetical protein